MAVNYNNAGTGLRYDCNRALVCYGAPGCQSLSGGRLDALVAEQVLAALRPAALELHLAAAADVEKQRQVLHQSWRQKLERAGYEAERAARQYEAVEPENRLVSRELERRWEAALHERARLEREYEQFGADQPARLTADQRGLIRRLAGDIPRLWSAATTTPADRQRLVRMLIERVVVTVRGSSEQVEVAISWSGGSASRHEMVRPVQRYEQLADYRRLRARIDQLRGSGQSMAVVAGRPQRGGLPPAQAGGAVHRRYGGRLPGPAVRARRRAGGPGVAEGRMAPGRAGATPGHPAGHAPPLEEGGPAARPETAGDRRPMGRRGNRRRTTSAGPTASASASQAQPGNPRGTEDPANQRTKPMRRQATGPDSDVVPIRVGDRLLS
jgi:hypothetical protein